jgi:hypothetical protein
MGVAQSNNTANTANTAPGCPASLKDLKALWPSGILQMDKEKQAEFADYVCREGAARASFSEQQLKSTRLDFPHAPPDNTTGVGNLALLALRAPEAYRKEWDAVYTGYIAMLKRYYGVA